jgi:hypothetical protein
LDYSGLFSFGEHPDQLKGEPQTLFGIYTQAVTPAKQAAVITLVFSAEPALNPDGNDHKTLMRSATSAQ